MALSSWGVVEQWVSDNKGVTDLELLFTGLNELLLRWPIFGPDVPFSSAVHGSFSHYCWTLETPATTTVVYGQEAPHSHSLLGSWYIPDKTTAKEVEGLKSSQESLASLLVHAYE